MKDRFDINILDENNWQIEDTETGEYANPVDGVTNVLKGLVKTMNNYDKKTKELQQIIQDNNDSIKMKHYVQDFFKMYQRYDTIKEEIKEIIEEHKNIIAWSHSEGKVYDFNLTHDSFTILIKATDIPYSLINELNKYVGKDCKMIGKTHHHITIKWRI